MTSIPKTTVLLKKCPSYTPSLLEEHLQVMMSYLDLPDTFHGRTILLKPNLISSRGPALACTNPLFLAAVARCFHDKGAKIRIGDSPAFGTTKSVMERHGMTAALNGLPFEQVHFKSPERRTFADGVTVDIAAEALECDLFVNLPRLKAHNQMYITCAVKNFFGIVVGMRKAMIHMRHGGSHREFSDILLALPDLVTPHLSLVDGIEVMHRSGPLDGEKLMLGCIAGAYCPVALDTAMLELLSLPKTHSPLWQAAYDQGHAGSQPENLLYPLDVPSQYHGSGFDPPEGLNPVRFNPFRLLLGGMRRLKLAICP